MPFVELISGALLVSGIAPAVGGAVSALLLLSFLVAVAVNLARRRSLDCHCFGTRGERIGWSTVLRLIVLLGGAVLVSIVGEGVVSHSDVGGIVLISAGIVLSLYLLGATPTAIAQWRIKAAPAPTLHGGRTSFRNMPLVPIAQALRDRSAEPSRCGGCQ